MIGRPSKYKPSFCEKARQLCERGATDAEVADSLGINAATLYRWKGEHSEFCEALKAGKAVADDRVEMSLYHKAIGYTFDSEKVFQFQGVIVRTDTKEHVPPDTTAAIFWLKNRRPDQWREKSEVNVRHEVDQMSDDDLKRIAAGGREGAVKAPVNSTKLN